MKHDGGPAFPQDLQGRRGDNPEYQGMSLRDWFAGQVAAGDAAANGGWASRASEDATMPRARLYYRIADAMLKAREEDSDGT